MLPQLPYPGFSWSINQHISQAAQNVIYELLQAAYIYAGDPLYDQKITEYMIGSQLLTANVRADSGRANTWRDYQQVLSELGLIVSTRYTNSVVVTPIGLMWLDGLIGYSELITTQALAYQYPNGHKDTIQAGLREILHAQGFSVPETRTALDIQSGILIKPGVLILRILLELLRRGENVQISTRECLAALVPTKTNAEWQRALEILIQIRHQNSDLSSASRSLRHVQEWYRLLSFTDLFSFSNNHLSLTALALNNIEYLESLCEYHENIENFWIPPASSRRQIALSWYTYYGNPAITSQWLVPENNLDERYISNNYPEGLEVEDVVDEFMLPRERNADINLQLFEPRTFTSADEPNSGKFDEARALVGLQRQQKSTRLHEQIVALLAQRFKQQGFLVYQDRDSVDLLASRDEQELIVEVKTVTRRNIDKHMRLGVGQLLEYRYRRQVTASNRPNSILVLSNSTKFPSWMIDYFQMDIRVGLISMNRSENFESYTNGFDETLITST